MKTTRPEPPLWPPTPVLRLIVNLRVAAAPGIVIPLAAEALRHEISNAIPAGVGIGAGTVNIIVEDLYDV